MEDLKQALAIIENSNYKVSNIEKFSALYFYLNSLKKKITEIETEVRKRGSELMSDMDLKKLSYQDYEIIHIDPTKSEVYRASAVIEALGMERAVAFLKVDAKITTYLKKASAKGVISMQEVMKCREGITKKYKLGYIKIQKRKA